MFTEWLKIMLEEISTKQEHAQRAREEATAREQQRVAETSTNIMTAPQSKG